MTGLEIVRYLCDSASTAVQTANALIEDQDRHHDLVGAAEDTLEAAYNVADEIQCPAARVHAMQALTEARKVSSEAAEEWMKLMQQPMRWTVVVVCADDESATAYVTDCEADCGQDAKSKALVEAREAGHETLDCVVFDGLPQEVLV